MVHTQGFISLNSKIQTQCSCQRVPRCKKKKKICAFKLNEWMLEQENQKTLFPQCKLRLSSFMSSSSHSVLLNKCNQRGGLGGMSVTKSNGSLQILQARWTGSPARKTNEGRKVYSPHILSRSPSLCLRFLQTSNFLTFPFSKSVHLCWWECSKEHNTAVVKLWFWLHPSIWGYRELMVSDEGKEKGTKFITIWHQILLYRIQGQWETILWHLKSSLPLCSLFSPPLIFMSASPLLSCLSAYFLSVFTLNPTALTCQESYKCSEWIM